VLVRQVQASGETLEELTGVVVDPSPELRFVGTNMS
jgi:hypothetical protein